MSLSPIAITALANLAGGVLDRILPQRAPGADLRANAPAASPVRYTQSAKTQASHAAAQLRQTAISRGDAARIQLESLAAAVGNLFQERGIDGGAGVTLRLNDQGQLAVAGEGIEADAVNALLARQPDMAALFARAERVLQGLRTAQDAAPSGRLHLAIGGEQAGRAYFA
jgi:hypothetical protein